MQTDHSINGDNNRLIAVMSGGFSTEAEISRQSAEQVFLNLKKNGTFEVVIVHVDRAGWTAEPEKSPVNLNDFSFELNGKVRKPSAAFIAIHGSPGEDGCLQAYFDMMDVPYTGCGRLASALTFNKDFCKRAVAGSGVDLSPSLLVRKNDVNDMASTIIREMEFPVFVKPNQNGSSFGISKVDVAENLMGALKKGFKYDAELLVETSVSGRELTCGVFTRDGKAELLPITEIVHQSDFFDYEAKYTKGGAQEIVPANIDDQMAERCNEISLKLYEQLNCRGLVRFDYIADDQKCWFLEVNTVPGLSEASIVPRMVRAAAWSEGDFYAHLITEALEDTNFEQ